MALAMIVTLSLTLAHNVAKEWLSLLERKCNNMCHHSFLFDLSFVSSSLTVFYVMLQSVTSVRDGEVRFTRRFGG